MDSSHPPTSSSEDVGDDAAVDSDEQSRSHAKPAQASSAPTSSRPGSSLQPSNASAPMQKRRRVTRACDECRRKKIKCDGMQPCTHCTVYSYECTYDQPSNRRRNPTPQYVEALESRLQRAEALLRNVLPDVDLDNAQLDSGIAQPALHPQIKREAAPQEPTSFAADASPATPREGGKRSSGSSENLLESMVDNTGSLDLDDQGNWDYHGQSSGLVFLRCLRDQFGDLIGKAEGYGMPFLKTRSISSPANASQSSTGSQMQQSLPNVNDLPPRECAKMLCENALDDACALMRIVHLPTFWDKFDRAYTLPPEQYQNAEKRFLPLLYVVLSLGAVFAKAERSHLQRWGYENAIDQGFTWFNASRSMIDVIDCRDLTSLQTVLFMILFLQSSSRLSTCYSYIGIVLRCSIRMGLHRSISANFNPIEQEIRKRIFWVVRKMDIYVAALLGLPMYLNDADIDQGAPLEVDDEYYTSERLLPMTPGRLSVMTSFNAHTRLVNILAKTTRNIYPLKGHTLGQTQSNAVSHAKVREIEQDLQAWMEGLPIALRPGGPVAPEIERVQQLLRMAYAHIQMFLYRPFLHYISQDSQAKSIDKRSYACAAACVSVARNVIHISDEMKKRGLLNGSYWFYMYTIFFAVLTLVFFVLENPNSPATQDILRDALTGRDTLASLARTSLAADRSMQTLSGLFEQLPRKLNGAKIKSTPQKKRQAPLKEWKDSSKPIQPVRSTPNKAANPLSKSGGSSEKRAENSVNTSNQATKLGVTLQETSMLHQPQARSMRSDYCPGSDDPYTPESGNVASFESASATPSSSAQSTFGPHQQGPNALPDLNDIMFPSSDPMVYPNQPMMTLENQNLFRADNTDMFDAPELPSTSGGPYETTDSQYLAPVPPYLMQGPQPGFGLQPMGPFTGMSSAARDNSMAVDDATGAWPSEQPQSSFGSREMSMNYDHFFEQGWMGQNYRPGQ